MTTTAKIKAKGCSATGLTEDIATKLYNTKGTRILAIVELKSDKTHESADGDRQVDLSIETIEPVVDGGLNGTLDEHVRNIAAALYRNRQLTEGTQDELPLDGDDGPAPKVADIIAQGDALLERDDDGQIAGTWDGEDDQDDEPADELDEDAEPDDATASPTTTPFSVVPS